MKGQLRKSGIDIIGDVPWGTHFCQFYQTKEDLIDILVPYFKAGLENNEFCIWVISEPVDVEEAREALKKAVPDLDIYLEKRQIEIIPYTYIYSKDCAFDSERVLYGCIGKINHALASGYDGLRSTGDISWLKKFDWNNFVDYEEKVDSFIGSHKMIALCTYPLDRCNATEIIEVVINHQFSLIKKEGKWEQIESSRRKKEEEAAIQAAKNWEHTFDAVPDLISILDTDYRIVRANKAMAARLGVTPEECVGLTCYHVVHGTDKPPSFCPHRQMLKDGREYTSEVCEEYLGGYFIVSVSPLYDSNEKLAGCIHIARDIKERKRAEKALREGEELLRFALETSHTGAWDLDLVDHTAHRSLEHDRIFGYEQLLPQWTYEMFIEHVLPEDREMVDTKFQKAMATHTDWNFDCRIRRVDGEVRWIWAAGQHRMGNTGSVCRMVGIVQDITESKHAEEALRESEAKLQVIVANSPDIIFEQDLDLRYTWVFNPTPPLSISDILGKTDIDLLPPDQAELLTSIKRRVLDTGIREQAVLLLTHGSESRWFEAIYEPRYDATGNIVGILSYTHDINERKQLEEQTRQRAEELETIMEVVPTPILICNDPQGHNITGNRMANEFEEAEVGENISASIRKDRHFFYKGCELNADELPVQQAALKNIDLRNVEFDVLLPSGKLRKISASASPLHNAEGHVRGSVGAFIDITDIKEAEAKLKETLNNLENLVKERTSELEEAYKSLRENERSLAEAQKMAHLGNWERTLSTSKIYWSDEMYCIFGLKPQELEINYHTFLSFIHPDDREYVDNSFKKALKGKPFDIDYRISLAGREERIVREHGEVTYNDENSPVQIRGTTQDVTERKKAEKALELSEERYRIVTEQTGQLVYDHNIDEDCTHWAGNIEKLTGFTPYEFKSMSLEFWLSRIHPEDLDRYLKDYNKYMKSGNAYRTEYRFRKKNEEYMYIEDNGVCLKGEKGNVNRILGVIKDITERKLSQEKIEISERKYRSFIENFKGIVYQADENFIPQFLHGAVKEITGYSEEEFLSELPWRDIIEPEYLPIILNEEIKTSAVPDTCTIEREFKIKNRDGKTRWVHETCQKVPGENGKPTYQGVIYDITERKQTEETLANIETARKKEIHHRIKNNLQVISSLLDLQAEKFKNRGAEDSEVLNAFRESQDRVTSIALIHEELHEGRGNDTLNFSPYIEKLVENLFQTYRLGNGNTCLNIELEENIFFDMDIAVPLGIIINELVSNSFKYAFPGKAKGNIEIKLYRERSARYKSSISGRKNEGYNDANFVLIVSDNGVGIPEDFDSENSSSLGLQLVRILVDQLGGELELKRSVGTEFTIKFTVTEKNIRH